nr:uncharacterized protein At1g08160-like [Ziziphus jujuba var. spinosa]
MKYIAFVVLGIIVVMSVALGTIWAVVKPKRPVYAIEYAHIEHAVINAEYTSLTGNFSYVMRSYNPNKKATIYYKSMKIYNSFSPNETSTSVWHLEDISQPPFNMTRIRFSFRHEFLSDNGIMVENLKHCRITVNISLKAEMRFEFGNWKSNPRAIKIFCQPATVMLGQNFEPTDCNVDL